MNHRLKEIGKNYFQMCKACKQPKRLPEDEVEKMLDVLQQKVGDIRIEWVNCSPYEDEYQLRIDASNGVIKAEFHCCAPDFYLTSEQYSRFRAYHDILHHCYHALSFSPEHEALAAVHLYYLLKSNDISKAVIDFAITNVYAINTVYAYQRSKWQRLDPYKVPLICSDALVLYGFIKPVN